MEARGDRGIPISGQRFFGRRQRLVITGRSLAKVTGMVQERGNGSVNQATDPGNDELGEVPTQTVGLLLHPGTDGSSFVLELYPEDREGRE